MEDNRSNELRPNDDNKRKLYDALSKQYDLGTYDDFVKDVNDESKRRKLYDAIVNDYDLPDYNGFSSQLGYGNNSHQTVKTNHSKPAAPSNKTTLYKQAGGDVSEEYTPTLPSSSASSSNKRISDFAKKMQMSADNINANNINAGVDRLNKRSENVIKGNKPLGSHSEKRYNPKTGKIEDVYYTVGGTEVATPLQQFETNLNEGSQLVVNHDTGKQEPMSNYWNALSESRSRQQIKNMFDSIDDSGDDNAAVKAWNRMTNNIAESRKRYYKDMEKLSRLPSGDPMVSFNPAGMSRGFELSVDTMKAKDAQKLMDDAWSNLGKDKQDKLINDIANQYGISSGDKSSNAELYKKAAQMARQLSDQRMMNYIVSKNIPSDTKEYLLSKIAASNNLVKLYQGMTRMAAGTTGDLSAKEAGIAKYEIQHDNFKRKIVGGIGTVIGFTVDPTIVVAGEVGKGALSGATWLGGKVAPFVSNRFATTLGGKAVTGAIGSAGNFATFETIGEAANQFQHGGYVNPATCDTEDYNTGAIGKAGLHGIGMGAATGGFGALVGNVTNDLVRGSESVAGKAGIRLAGATIGTIGEGTIFSLPDIVKGNLDTWDDNMAMIIGFKIHGAVKSAPNVIKSIASTPNSRLKIEDRITRVLNGTPDLALTKDESQELEHAGYGDLTNYIWALKNRKDVGAAVDTFNEQIGNPNGASLDLWGKGEPIYERFTKLIDDANVSEAARAKMYHYITGDMLPMSTVMGSKLIENKDDSGKVIGYTVQSFGANGVITNKNFTSSEKAGYEKAQIDRQAELNSIALGERVYDNRGNEGRMHIACKNVGEQMHVSENMLYDLMKKDPQSVSQEERDTQEIVLKSYNELGNLGSSEALRKEIGDRTGVNIDTVIRKHQKERSIDESSALTEYARSLFPSGERVYDDVKQNVELRYITDGESAQVVPDKQPSDNNIGLVNEGEKIDSKDAFDEGYNSDAQGRMDIAISNTINPNDPIGKVKWKGVEKKIEDEADYEIAMQRERNAKIQDKDGNIRAVKLHNPDKDGNDKEAYIIDGNVVMMDDGKTVDKTKSSHTIVIYDPETGNTKMIDPSGALGVVYQTSTNDDIERGYEYFKDQYIKNEIEAAQGKVNLNPGDSYTLPGGGEAIVLAVDDTNVVMQLPDGKQQTMAIADIQDATNAAAIADYQQRKANEGATTEINNNDNSEDNAQIEPSAQSYNVSNKLPEGYAYGKPGEYSAGTELAIIDAEGNLKPAVIMSVGNMEMNEGNTQLEYVPSNSGKVVEYMMGGEVHRDRMDVFEKSVSGYIPEKVEEKEPADVVTKKGNIEEASSNASEEPAGIATKTPVEPSVAIKESDDVLTTLANVHAKRTGMESDYIAAKIANATERVKKSIDKKNTKNELDPDSEEWVERQNEIRDEQTNAQAQLNYWTAVDKALKDEATKAEEKAKKEASDKMLEEQRIRAEADKAAHDAAVAQQKAEYEERKKAEEERKAAGVENAMPNIIDKWDKASKVDGAQEEIVLPNGERLKGHYVLHESGASSPSHDPHNWKKTDGFPMDTHGGSVNDRDYERDKDAQQVTFDIARSYDQRALQTPVVVSNDGVVLSGNGRTMAGELAADAGTDKAYIKYLHDYAGKYGFTPEQVENMKHPRVSFVPDERIPYTAETFAKFNTQEMKSQNKTESAVKLGKTVGDDIFKSIVNSINRYETIGDFYNDTKGGLESVGLLRQAGVIPQAQMAEMVDGARGQERLSSVGREMLENILIGKAFENNPDAIRMLTEVPSMRQSVITALGVISDNVSLGNEYMLQNELSDAVKLCYDARMNGYKYGENVSSFAKQGVLFSFPDSTETVADINNITMLMLSDVLNDSRVTQLKVVLTLYNNQARESAAGQFDLFADGIKSKEDILKEIIRFIKNGNKEEIATAQQAAVEQRKESSINKNGPVNAGSETGGQKEPTGKIEPYNKSKDEGENSEILSQQHIAEQEAIVNTEPTEGQKEAGNYKMGHIKLDGYDITIENPKGSIRSGKDKDGEEWHQTMNNTYGYIRLTEGVDGDHIDIFLSDSPTKGNVYVIDQVDPKTGEFDEHKCMYGFDSIEDAKKAYLSNYSKGWNGLGTITEVSKDEFKKWVESSHRKTKPFNEYAFLKDKVGKQFDMLGRTYTVSEKDGDLEMQEVNDPLKPRMNGYSVHISHTKKTGKEVYSVRFDGEDWRDKETRRGRMSIAKSDAFKGWYSNDDGYTFRTLENAHDFAETILNRSDEEVKDEAPLTMKDVDKATNIGPKEEQKQESKKTDSFFEEDADEWERLKRQMNDLHNRMNIGIDPQEYAIGVKMSYFVIKHGMRKFGQFAKKMIDELGEWIRPYLKSIYNGARDIPEMEMFYDELTPYEEVRKFDVFNFDKEVNEGPIDTAEHVTNESEAEHYAKNAEQKLKDIRNEKRRETEKQKSADTDAIGSESEVIASKAIAFGQEATTDKQVNEQINNVDAQIKKVDEQLKNLDEPIYESGVSIILKNGQKIIMQGVANKDSASNFREGEPTISNYYGITSDNERNIVNFKPGDVDLEATKKEQERIKEIPEDVKENAPIGEEKITREHAQDILDGIVKGDISTDKRPDKWKNLKVGDKVYYNIGGVSNEATVLGFDKTDGLPLLDTGLAPVMTVRAFWDQIKRQDELTRKDETINKPRSKKNSQPAQQTDIFDVLFNKEPSKPKNDGKEEIQLQSSTSTTKREGGHEPQQNEPLGKSERNEVERPNGNGVDGRDTDNIMPDTERISRLSRADSVGKHLEQPKNTHNNHAERGTDYAPKGENARIEANIKAIDTMKRLVDNDEQATPDDMSVLRKFSGWGGLGRAFQEETDSQPNQTNMKLRKLLSPLEYDAANMSRNSAYYTPAKVIDTMWDIARALGFKGGNVLEGSAGIGNIIGLMPTDLSDNSNIRAVEIDDTTGKILKLLYPDVNVDVRGFEKTHIPNGSVDLSITNVPFVTGLHVMDDSGDGDLSKKFRNIHDFCIAKNVRKLKEGGIGIFITSNGTLDNSNRLLTWIINDGKSDVVGAFRMNNATFGGTGATSDIIVIRKRVNGKKSSNAIDVSGTQTIRTVQYDDGERKKNSVKTLPLDINKYFVEHPENMGGEMAFAFEKGDNYRATSKALYPSNGIDQNQRLLEWTKRMGEKDWSLDMNASDNNIKESQSIILDDKATEGHKVGEMVIKDGKLSIVGADGYTPLDLNENKVKGHTKEECFNAYKAIKDTLSDLLDYQTNNDDNNGLKERMNALNKSYDAFVNTYGHIVKNPAITFLFNDMDYPSVAALENVSETGDKNGKRIINYKKSDIFYHRVVEKESELKPTNVRDGVIASIYKNGRIDVPYIAGELGESDEEVKRKIIESGLGFENPTTTEMDVSYEYLSGNVRESLNQAKANNTDGRYDANIKALEKVLPMDIPAHLIEFSIGSSWIDPILYEEYIHEKTGLEGVKVTNVGGTWMINTQWYTNTEQNKAMGVKSDILGKTILGHQLIEAAMRCKSITVSKTEKNEEGTTNTIVDKDATTACMSKIDDIRQEFKDWARKRMQTDTDMSARMERIYNDQFNNSVPKEIPDEFVPDHFGGASHTIGGNPFQLRPHQAKAAVRATTQPLMLAHEVGTGKTYTLITTAMEMRRLGTARKPMIVVQNATVGQFVSSSKALYPNAKILTLEDVDRTAEGRRNFNAKIRYNDWDMIVVPQSVFDRIPDSPEREQKFIWDKIQENMDVIEKMKNAAGKNSTNDFFIKQAERELKKLQQELDDNKLGTTVVKNRDAKKEAKIRQNAEVKAREMLDRETDKVANFDELGIDALLIDEAHEYKHLGFATAMQRGVKGIDPSYSKKSQGVYLKTQSVLEKNNGKNVVFATGTPISNTAAEIWTFMRYLIPSDTMKEYGIYYFDDFVRNFGSIEQRMEFSTNGKYKENTRFTGYSNLPELVRIWSTVSDTVLTRDAGGVSDKIPQLKGGKPEDIYLPQTKALRSVMKFVKKELDVYECMTGKEKKSNSHIPLVMYGIAKAAAVDPRLVMEDAEDEPNSKTNATVREVLKDLKETESYKGTVAIFADNYMNKKTGFNLYEDIKNKLIDAGVPEGQIVVMKGGMSVKKKLDIFDKVNSGDVRVILGSTFTLGTGVNIQERLHLLIHVDAPNRPMDYTQRNGREMRQGNLHNVWGLPVRIVRFGVEDSLDVTAYQRLKTKGAIADSIMNGKQLMSNSMENRVLEEEEDAFGDITAQLSGSEYALLKNASEKEVRKLQAKKKQHEADQTYVHNKIPQLKSRIQAGEERIKNNQDALSKIEGNKKEGITVGNQHFTGVDMMGDFIKEYNAKQREMQEKVRKSYNDEAKEERTLKVNVGGFNFDINSTIAKEAKRENGQFALTFSAKTNMTYSCKELGLDEEPVVGQQLKSALEDITKNVITGDVFRERIDTQQRALERNQNDLKLVEARNGKEFEYEEDLKKAQEKLAEYSEKMIKEIAEKEKKYRELDASVEEAKGVINPEEDEEEENVENDNAVYRLREDEEPKKTGIGYKVFVLKDGKLYPPMVANPNGEATPMGVWLDADAAPIAGESKTGRPQVKSGGKGTQGGSGILAYRPGWHLGEIPYALQFNRIDKETGEKNIFPKNFVWAEVEYAADVDYQKEANKEGVNASGKYQHSLAGLKHLPVNGSYRYRTNPNPETDPWIITGAMKVNRILKPSEVDTIVDAAGREPQSRQEGSVTDEEVEELNNNVQRAMQNDRDMMRKTAEQIGQKFNTPIHIYDSADEITNPNASVQERRRTARGWYNTSTGEVNIVLSNNRDVEDVTASVAHEVVAHKGLRELVGNDNYGAFCDMVYNHLSESIKNSVDERTKKEYESIKKDVDDKTGNTFIESDYNESYEECRRKAVDEMFGEMAEKHPEDYNGAERTLWTKIKESVRRILDKFLGSLKLPKWFKLGDNEIRYMLWKSAKHLEKNRGPIEVAEDVAKRGELGLDDKTVEDTALYRDGETGETDDIWKDGSVGMEERIVAATARLAENHKSDDNMRDSAMRAISKNIGELRKAMNLQKQFDKSTVKRVTDFARVLIQYGYLDGITSGETKRLLSTVNNSVGVKDLKETVNNIMDIMVNSQLRNSEEQLHKMEIVRGSKVDAKGVEVMGMLDPNGQSIIKTFKNSRMMQLDDIENAISDAQDSISNSDKSVSENASLEYTGLMIAKDYIETIGQSKQEEKELRRELKELHDNSNADDRITESYREQRDTLEEAIRTNRAERIDAYTEIISRLGGTMNESIQNADAFRKSEKQRIEEIQHNANSDMEGRPTDEHHQENMVGKFTNNSFVQFVFSPLATFDQMLRLFGSKSVDGEGYLYNRFMRGWVDARQKEITGVRGRYKTLDEKAMELFGDNGVKDWGGLIRYSGKLKKMKVKFWNGGEMKDTELTQGNLMYIYMVNKMLDGRMKLRKMGIEESAINDIEQHLDPRIVKMADWLQDEFLVGTRNEYNETHKRIFGASMASVEHYFPLKILANARADKPEDLDNPDRTDGISTTTGSIIKRRRNTLALDITGADALHVILDHVAQMEHWNAYSEYNRDLNTLRTYKHFRNQVQNMNTIYGSGKMLWNKFNDVCQMSTGSYRSPRANFDVAATNFAKGVTAAKVSFRIFTALKQFLSAPAYIPEANPMYLAASIAQPWNSWNWCMKNLPIFKERWESRTSGDPRLLKSEMDWKAWRSSIIQIASRIGMSPNAFIDALTVSIGAYSMYETRRDRYLKDGYDNDRAEKKARQDSEVLYNQTQQSSEGPFTSTMQVDKSWLSVMFTVFRNSNFAYQRQLHDAIRNIKRNLTPGNKEKSIDFMTNQFVRDGFDEKQATSAANRKYKKQIIKDVMRVSTFGYIMQLAWNLGAYLPYILFGSDEDEKNKMWDDVWSHTAFGWTEGYSGGDVISSAGNMIFSGEGNTEYLTKDMPISSDISTIMQKFGSKEYNEAVNDIVNLVVQSGIGVNPQSITDAALAIMDACGDDPKLAHEATIFVMRVLQVPQGQIDKMYFDEIGMKGSDVSKYTPEQLAERYARYKVKRGSFFESWTWDDEDKLEKKNQNATKKIRERVEGEAEHEVNESYDDLSDKYKDLDKEVNLRKNAIKKAYDDGDKDKGNRLSQQFSYDMQNDERYVFYTNFKNMDKILDKWVDAYMKSKDTEESDLCRDAISTLKKDIVAVLNAKEENRYGVYENLMEQMNYFAERRNEMRNK